MNSINTNMSALTAQQNMQKQNAELDQAMARLSSGLRINSAADDAAGSAIASKMEAQVRSLDVAIRNSYDAISMTQTVEGALGEMENVLQRVRELSVQAANSTLSTSDRTMIQAEVDALITEIDSIAKNTHFNNVKLLDGSNANVSFQIGTNTDGSLVVDLEKSDSTALGLFGSTGVSSLTSGRMLKTNYNASGASIAVGDIKINGFDAFSRVFDDDLSGATTNTAKIIADEINLNTGVHGANVNAFNTFTSNAMGDFNMTSVFQINSIDVAVATSYSGLVANINEAVSGIVASLNSDNSITLSNKTGADIIIGANGSTVGFEAGTFTGFLEISNLDGTDVTIEAGSVKNGYTGGAGTIADVQKLGFNEFSEGGVLETDTVSGTALNANELKVNDVLIGSSLSGSANHVADAINAKTSEHGVTADASNELEVTFDYSSNPKTNTSFAINGHTIDLSSATGAAAVVTAVNTAGVGDIRASANSDGTVSFKSASGVDIIIGNNDNDFLVSAKDIHGTALTDGFGNGTFDLDGLVSGHTVVADKDNAIDISGSTLVGEVVNSRIVVTFDTNASYAGDADDGITIRGTDSSGNNISETILFGTAAKAVGEQQFGSTNFHTVTSVHNAGATGPLAGGKINIGFAGNVVSDTLRAASVGLANGGAALANLRNNTNINGFVTITHSAADASDYDIEGIGFDGEAISETVSLAGAGTVTSQEMYKSVTKITSKADTDANGNQVSAGVSTFNASALDSLAHSTAAGTVVLNNTDENTFKENLGGAVITLSSVSDYSSTANNVKFTVTGTDIFGATISEDIVLNTNNGEVHGTTKFNSVTSIVTDNALQAVNSVEIGLALVGDRVEAKGNMTLTNADKTAIRLEAVGDDSIANLASNASVDTILQKLGAQNQSQSFEVSGQGVSVSTESQATASLSKIDAALDQLSLFRSSFGAVENRIDASINNLTTLKVNTEAAKARIQDADFAAETSKMTKSQILSQAATSMLAQANASKQNLLALLQG